jgi:hypothetical protein
MATIRRSTSFGGSPEYPPKRQMIRNSSSVMRENMLNRRSGFTVLTPLGVVVAVIRSLPE